MPNAPCPVVSRLTVSRLPRGHVFGYPCDAASAAAYGRLPEWPKGTVCKTVGSAYVGSNPTPATTSETASDLWLRGRGLSSSQPGPYSQMPPEAATCRYPRDICGMDLRAGRRNDQYLADARCTTAPLSPEPQGAVRIARIHPCQASPDEIRGNLGNPLAQSY